jgi:hypothetical protein
MLALKLPLAGLIYIVWWAIKQEPEDAGKSDDDGGIRRQDRPHPIKPFPRRPRRGPHGDPPPVPPARVRTVKARARSLGH